MPRPGPVSPRRAAADQTATGSPAPGPTVGSRATPVPTAHDKPAEEGQGAARTPLGPGAPRTPLPAAPPSTGRPRLPVSNEISAGGLICRRVGNRVEGALIGRLDRSGVLRWLLPKGHLEDGETATDAAAREVAEETGITGHVVAEIGTVDYWFTTAEKRVHKTVHHYLLEADGGALSTDDPEVDEVAWVSLPEVLERLSYDDERRLAARVSGLLATEA